MGDREVTSHERRGLHDPMLIFPSIDWQPMAELAKDRISPSLVRTSEGAEQTVKNNK